VKNKRAERYCFRKWAQLPCKSIKDYIAAALRGLSTTCDYGAFADDAIIDQLIEKNDESQNT